MTASQIQRDSPAAGAAGIAAGNHIRDSGGHHRSVAVTEALARHLALTGHETERIHRDVAKS